MSWQNEMVRILRFLINDINSVSYSDERLEETVLVNCQFIISEIAFDTTYTVDVDSLTLSPDPTSGTKDNAFINLTCLRTAAGIARNEVQAASSNCFRISDGPSSIDMTTVYKAKQEIANNLQAEYDNKKLQYQMGNISAVAAVITPTTVDLIGGYYSPR
jgi:hypothetical protein